MSTTSQLTTFSDLYTDLLNRVRADTSVTATANQAKRYINIGLHDMALGFQYKMPWLEREAYIRTHAPYTTGTVSITAGSTTVTGASTLWTTANSYNENNARTTGKMTVAGGTDIYRITTVTNDTSITLTDRYVASADASGATYTYFEDEYALASDFLRPIDYRIFSDATSIALIGRNEWRRRFPRPNISGTPKVATLVDRGVSGDTTFIKRVQFYPYPSTAFLIPYAYVTSTLAFSSAGVAATSLSGDTDEPNMPLGYRHAIVYHALYHWYRDKRDDARSQEAKAEYTDIMLRIAGDTDIGAPSKASLVSGVSMYAHAATRPYSNRSGGRLSVNDSFDRFES